MASFVESLRPAPGVKTNGVATYRNSIRDEMSEIEAADWASLANDLSHLDYEPTSRLRVAAFTDWLPRVADYTFHPWRPRDLLVQDRDCASHRISRNHGTSRPRSPR